MDLRGLRCSALLVLGALALAGCRRQPTPASGAEPLVAPKRLAALPASTLRGICHAHMYEGPHGYGSPSSRAQLEELRTLGANWISVTPFGFVEAATEGPVQHVDELMKDSKARAWFEQNNAQAETDALVQAELALERSLGLKTQLKPHLWMLDDSWRGKIHRDEAGWAEFWASYRRWILHYADLAAAEDVAMLVVGVELDQTVVRFEAQWRALIRDVRARYRGKLTYAANWDAYEAVPFWDALDYVGVQFYPPLADRPAEDEISMAKRLESALHGLDRIAARTKRPVLLTEVGYRAVRGTAVSPHQWPDPEAKQVDEAAQARAYRVLLRGLAEHPRIAGVFLWKWYTAPQGDEGPAGFSPRGYAAEAELAAAFGGRVPVRPKSNRSDGPARAP